MMRSFRPAAALRDRVVAIDHLVHPGGDATVLPSAGAVLGFQLQGRVRAGHGLLATAGVTGVQPTARHYDYLGPTTSLLVRFTPQGAACLGVPAADLASRSVPLEALVAPAVARAAQERLLAATTVEAQVASLEHFLHTLPFTADRLIERAVAQLTRAPDLRIAGLARSLGLGERQLERRFLARVGTTPKRFASLRRFERAVAAARTAPSLTDVAFAAGYYDQSHFIREVRRLAGVSPRALLHPR